MPPRNPVLGDFGIGINESDTSDGEISVNNKPTGKPEIRVENEADKKIYWVESTKGKVNQIPKSSTKDTIQSEIDSDLLAIKGKNGKYTEIPHLLDGFRMLNWAQAEDPEEVYVLNLSGQELELVIEEDIAMFRNLHTLNASENALPLSKLGPLTNLKRLVFSCNGVETLDLELDGKFNNLEYLDLSYNKIDYSAQIVLATLPNLRYLDLTGNKIKFITPDIHDLHNWRDKVIELILPYQVAALNLVPASESHEEANRENDEEFSVASHLSSQFGTERRIQGPNGFQSLETLILEHNPLDPSVWFVLGKLKNLRSLNLNRTSLQNLNHMIPSKYHDFSIDQLLSLNRTTIDVTSFPKLNHLQLMHNNIKLERDLIGLIFFPALMHVFVNGNPVSRLLFGGSRSAGVLTPKQMVLALQLNFGITVEDSSLEAKPSTIPPHVVTISKNAVEPTIKKEVKLNFKRKVTKNTKANWGLNSIVLKTVPDISVTKSDWIQERSERRHHNFTEEDLKKIIKNGFIPSMKTFKETETEQKSEEKQSSEPITETNTLENPNQDLDYRPEIKDPTFLTGVHITGNLVEQAETAEPEDIPMMSDLVDQTELKPDIEFGQELDIPLPSNITATVRALRFALKNPGMIWRSVQAQNKKECNKNIKECALPPKSRLPVDEFEELEDILNLVNDKMETLEKSMSNHFLNEDSIFPAK
jgi:Leucine-rich repeat (LRR) protein